MAEQVGTALGYRSGGPAAISIVAAADASIWYDRGPWQPPHAHARASSKATDLHGGARGGLDRLRRDRGRGRARAARGAASLSGSGQPVPSLRAAHAVRAFARRRQPRSLPRRSDHAREAGPDAADLHARRIVDARGAQLVRIVVPAPAPAAAAAAVSRNQNRGAERRRRLVHDGAPALDVPAARPSVPARPRDRDDRDQRSGAELCAPVAGDGPVPVRLFALPGAADRVRRPSGRFSGRLRARRLDAHARAPPRDSPRSVAARFLARERRPPPRAASRSTVVRVQESRRVSRQLRTARPDAPGGRRVRSSSGRKRRCTGPI